VTGRRLVIVRHGRTAHNADGRFQGHLDTPLDDIGRAQAADVAKELLGFEPAAIMSSDSMRAVHTAEPLGVIAGLDVVVDPRLREVDMGRWTGLTRAEAEVAFPSEYAAWTGGTDSSRGGGETFGQVADRSAAAVEECLASVPAGRTLVVFTHGGTARALTGRLLELPWEWSWRLRALENVRRTVLDESPRGWRLREYNAGTSGN
jgi:probable phosphoglycerate mutase